MKKILIGFFILCIISLFDSCVLVKSYVTSFHKLPPFGDGRNFNIVPFNYQKGSIEFSIYEERVSKKIEAHGYKRVKNSSTIPNYLVFINYGIDDGATTSGVLPVEIGDGLVPKATLIDPTGATGSTTPRRVMDTSSNPAIAWFGGEP